MSGIYIHIPFCKQKCSYCDFHFSTNKRLELEMVGAIRKEFINKKSLFQEVKVETVYFGGGSPSFISSENLGLILQTIRDHYSVNSSAEVTIECNPDDIDQDFADSIYQLGFNRISLGIQSFDNDDLKLMNRAHNSQQAEESVAVLKNAGFRNITVDLIYGLPGSTLEKWKKNVKKALELDVPHISSYCLTIEDKTLLKHQIDKGQIRLPQDTAQVEQFKYLVKTLTNVGYDHYEISNFAKDGFRSIHNSSYWRNKDYIGIGPSAHSKLGNRRFWNISNNSQYIKRLETDMEIAEEEFLSEKDQFNELIMIGLRTKEGVSIHDLQKFSFYDIAFQKQLDNLTEKGKIRLNEDRITIEGENKFIADTIISDLFIV